VINDSGQDVPVCRAHREKITRCDECARKLNVFWKQMSRVEPRGYPGISGADWNSAVDRAVLENQERLHSWAVANLYVGANELEPF
jgi:hypothetical protein